MPDTPETLSGPRRLTRLMEVCCDLSDELGEPSPDNTPLFQAAIRDEVHDWPHAWYPHAWQALASLAAFIEQVHDERWPECPAASSFGASCTPGAQEK